MNTHKIQNGSHGFFETLRNTEISVERLHTPPSAGLRRMGTLSGEATVIFILPPISLKVKSCRKEFVSTGAEKGDGVLIQLKRLSISKNIRGMFEKNSLFLSGDFKLAQKCSFHALEVLLMVHD